MQCCTHFFRCENVMCTLPGSPKTTLWDWDGSRRRSQQKRQVPSDISMKTGWSEFWPWILAAGTYASDSFLLASRKELKLLRRHWSFWVWTSLLQQTKETTEPPTTAGCCCRKTWSIISFINTLISTSWSLLAFLPLNMSVGKLFKNLSPWKFRSWFLY